MPGGKAYHGMARTNEPPVPRFPVYAPPGELKRFLGFVDGVLNDFSERHSGAVEPYAGSHGAFIPLDGDLGLGCDDLQGEKRTQGVGKECKRGGLIVAVGGMESVVEGLFHFRPVTGFRGMKEVPLMEAYLPFGLPEPEATERGEKDYREENPGFLASR